MQVSGESLHICPVRWIPTSPGEVPDVRGVWLVTYPNYQRQAHTPRFPFFDNARLARGDNEYCRKSDGKLLDAFSTGFLPTQTRAL